MILASAAWLCAGACGPGDGTIGGGAGGDANGDASDGQAKPPELYGPQSESALRAAYVLADRRMHAVV